MNSIGSPDCAFGCSESVSCVVYQCTVTMRTLEDGSYMKMLEKESLNVDLGCRGTVRAVGMRCW